MKILIAEHDRMELRALRSLLDADGHDVLAATTCGETLAKFEYHQPDLVLMDIALPDGGGYRCTREIAAASGSGFTPVILTASSDDRMTLAEFIESEAVDFVDAPGNVTMLKAKIAGFERMRDVYRQQERFQTRMRQEVKLAQHMFDRVIRRSPGDVDFLRHWMITAGHFCGDLLIYERTPADQLHILMGDFTGHGLSAAVGALPTSDVFFAMTRKGYAIGEIAAEINRKLNDLLPTGHFCAATLLRLSPLQRELEVWNGGQPPLLMLDDAGHVVREVPAFRFPLGVVAPDRFEADTLLLSLEGIRYVVLCSDGLLEAQNARGEMFGNDGLHGALADARAGGGHVLQYIKSELVGFLDGMEPHDDVSLLTVDIAGT